MRWLSDDAVAHLRNVTELPDLTGTRYRLVGEIARGGMGVVYEADDLELERRVALKVLASELASADAVERMRSEARIIARLEHPGSVPVHDVGTLPDGRIFYAMKLVRGTRLDRWAREDRSLTELLRAFVRVCEAVAFAHANGVVHRDLKPENVMVGELGAVLVMDWGVATRIGEDEEIIAGTPGYMPPESVVDARTDVFALGAMLRSLVGNAPRQLVAICAKATAHDRDTRYADARALAEDVLRFLDAEPVSAYRENVFEIVWRWIVRYRALIAIVTAYLVMRALVFFFASL
ncbi:MAG TPA: serine/threonine-protein kinase [Thermoanaerobaculia bacterium]|nr:serine/threonine-protein kinase [Thermoanaerobaculia bacterium]